MRSASFARSSSAFMRRRAAYQGPTLEEQSLPQLLGNMFRQDKLHSRMVLLQFRPHVLRQGALSSLMQLPRFHPRVLRRGVGH